MFTQEVLPFETDLYGLMKPSQLLRLCMHSCAEQIEAEQVNQRFQALGRPTGWMLARFVQEQLLPIRSGDQLELRCSYRCPEGAAYLRRVEVWANGEPVAHCRLLWMLVDMEKRQILRTRELEPLLEAVPRAEEIPPVPRVALPKVLPEQGSGLVRYSDCDRNGHFSSANYVDLLCDRFGFWKSGPGILRTVRMEYHSEFLPESELVLYGQSQEGRLFARGEHPQGKSGFSAILEKEFFET